MFVRPTIGILNMVWTWQLFSAKEYFSFGVSFVLVIMYVAMQ